MEWAKSLQAFAVSVLPVLLKHLASIGETDTAVAMGHLAALYESFGGDSAQGRAGVRNIRSRKEEVKRRRKQRLITP